MPISVPVSSKKFLTNQGENTLSQRLETILPGMRSFDCLVGYFFISGFFRLYPALELVEKIRILIGLKNEQAVCGLLQIARDPAAEAAQSTAEIRRILGGMVRSELVQADDLLCIETGFRKFIEWIRSGKLTVKLYREQNIHAKVYILTPAQPLPDVNHGYVITGSSNFSYSGLQGHLEFNVLLNEPEDHDYALHRFNELWVDAVDVRDVHETILQVVEQESPFAFFTPYKLYLKFLAEYFRDYLGDRSRLNPENLPANFRKLQYREDAVFTAQQMLKTYGGVFIADIVGLGKTFISALLALQLDGRCLVIAPPSLLDENSPGSRTKAEVESGTLFLSSASSLEQRQAVIANFDANSHEENDDYRILVTTDVLAESVNLHRSATVINYDIPWNPSRLMQQVGRVNRVGTKFKTILTYNFFPKDEGNDEIALTEAAKAKIYAFITLLGNDARLLTGDEEITSHNLFDRINSRKAAEGDPAKPKSELKYLRLILEVKEQQPEWFQRILALPRKARKFFRAHSGQDCAEGINLQHDSGTDINSSFSTVLPEVYLPQSTTAIAYRTNSYPAEGHLTTRYGHARCNLLIMAL